MIIIVVVSVAGVLLLLLNIVLVSCFVRKRRTLAVAGGGKCDGRSSFWIGACGDELTHSRRRLGGGLDFSFMFSLFAVEVLAN